jgi:hypothetical protein
MNKQKILTMMGIVLSFIIAISGWALTSMLIDMKSDSLFSMSDVMLINTPELTPLPLGGLGDDVPNDNLSISEHEIVSILQNWKSRIPERPHEPMQDQISMEQAIEIAQVEVLSYVEQGLFHSEILELSLENAYLCQKVQEGSGFLNPIYSYWSITLVGEGMMTNLIINAVTGQIWKCNFMATKPPAIEFNINDMENILNVFLSNMGLNNKGEAEIYVGQYEEMIAVRHFADNSIYAVLSTESGRLGDNSLFSTRDITIYLTTQRPVSQ